MKRRSCLKAMLAAAGGAVLPAVAFAGRPASEGRPIQLHADLAVDPAKEQEMLEFFEQKFRPAAAQQPGYIDLKMLKLKSALRGAAPPGNQLPVGPDLFERGVATEMGRDGPSQAALADHRRQLNRQKL